MCTIMRVVNSSCLFISIIFLDFLCVIQFDLHLHYQDLNQYPQQGLVCPEMSLAGCPCFYPTASLDEGIVTSPNTSRLADTSHLYFDLILFSWTYLSLYQAGIVVSSILLLSDTGTASSVCISFYALSHFSRSW